ncbi:MAG: beta-galactosidase [Ruminococcaceae bacterium]|nr:beta-galactosidase [Oscillospiraceae bacterium]
MSNFSFSGKSFYLDNKPFIVISGAMHYWRIVPEYWEDRLKKLKACGFNTLETYVPWNLHERREGQFDFSGNLDIVKYIETAAKIGLKVIVRPGPYICAEFDFGGLPSWLLAYPDIHLRCNDPKYLEKVRPYYRELLTRIAPLQCTNGGPIIMVQIENEYGSYGDDKEYLHAVADIYHEYGLNCQLFTSDGPCYWMLNGGTLPEYLCVANFGSRPDMAFDLLADFRPDQPSMCGEFWCGWFDHWGEIHHTRTSDETLRDVRSMLDRGASFNFYMFHGGTNFGFTSGANHTGSEYQPTITSYDYCAPLTESGDMTQTYYDLREELARFNGSYCDISVENTKKAAYGKIELTECAPLFDNIDAIGTSVHSAAPLSMEEVGQDFGFILYSSTLKGPMEERPLVIEHLHDRAFVYLNGKFAGLRERTKREDEIKISLAKGETMKIDILVENCGRVNYGPKLFDKKGIFGGIRLGQMYHFGWDITSMTMDDISGLKFTSNIECKNMPSFLRGNLKIEGTPADTFIRLDGFHKGFVVVNGFNIGRYWNDRGPQKTLYVPAPILHSGDNEITVFESDSFDIPVIESLDEPDLG